MKTNTITRRAFILASTGVTIGTAAAVLGGAPTEKKVEKRWYKMEPHCHTAWSDGRILPEVLVDNYKREGYHFLCLTDHNVIQTADLRFSSWGYNGSCPDEAAFEGETSYWKEIRGDAWSCMAQQFVDEAKKRFGDASVKTKQIGDSTYVRLKTFDELNEQFAEPGEFVMAPAFEQTDSIPGFGHVHMNFLNVPETLPSLGRENAQETIRVNFAEGLKAYGEFGKDWLFTVNHPLWQFYNVQPSDLIALPQVRVLELINNGSDYPLPDENESWRPEKFWDVVNAFRCLRGQLLLFADGSSDNHWDWENMFEDARGWTYVLAEELTPEAIFQAINRGDFYPSNGLVFETIAFDRETRTLDVKIKAEPGKKYRIEFFGTFKDFDQSMKTVRATRGDFVRDIEVWSDDIGVRLASFDGPAASYQAPEDLLYVRARAVELDDDGNPKFFADPNGHSGVQRNVVVRPAAWTQPFSSLVN